MKQLSYLLLAFACLCTFSLAQETSSDDIVDGGVYYIKGLEDMIETGNVLEIGGKCTVSKANLIQNPYRGTPNQKFRFDILPDKSYKITVVASGMVLEVLDGSNRDGARIVQNRYKGGSNQKWTAEFDESCWGDETGEQCQIDKWRFSNLKTGKQMAVETWESNHQAGARIVQNGLGTSAFKLTRIN